MSHATMTRRLRLEALVAYPPTARCKQVLELLKALLTAYPDQLRLDVYYAGEAPDATPTRAYQALDKRKTIPSGYVNGRMLLSKDLPTLDALRQLVETELQADPSTWQA
jgi:hypothetical protein